MTHTYIHIFVYVYSIHVTNVRVCKNKYTYIKTIVVDLWMYSPQFRQTMTFLLWCLTQPTFEKQCS